METQVYEQQTWGPAWLVVIRTVLESDPKAPMAPRLSPASLSQLAKHNMLGSRAEPPALLLAQAWGWAEIRITNVLGPACSLDQPGEKPGKWLSNTPAAKKGLRALLLPNRCSHHRS